MPKALCTGKDPLCVGGSVKVLGGVRVEGVGLRVE